MIGGAAGRLAVGEGEAQLPARVVHHGLEPAAGRHAPDAERPVPEAADHVEVDHGHGALDGDGGVPHVVARAEEPDLLAREQTNTSVRGAPAVAKAWASSSTTAVPEALSSAPGYTAPPERPRWS